MVYAKILYRVHREIDEDGNPVCYPVLKKVKIEVDPSYRNKKMVYMTEWAEGTNSGTWGHSTRGAANARLADGTWLSIVEAEAWVMRSNAAYVDSVLTEACETGTAELEIIVEVEGDKEAIEELENEYREEGDNIDTTVAEWIKKEIRRSAEVDDYLKQLLETGEINLEAV